MRRDAFDEHGNGGKKDVRKIGAIKINCTGH